MDKRHMKLMTKEIRKKIPELGAQDELGYDALVYVKYFTPDNCWTWWATEMDPDTDVFFGLVQGLEQELGYFALSELEEARGPMGLPIERDMHFHSPQRLRDCSGVKVPDWANEH